MACADNQNDPVAESPVPSAVPPAKPGVLQGDVGTERAMVVICALLVALAGALLYSTAVSIPLNGRDLDLFGNSDALHRVVTAPMAFVELPHAPLTALGFGLNWGLFPGPAAQHAVSLWLHVLAAVLAYLCARRLVPAGTPEPIAMLGGLWLAAGPVAAPLLAVIAERPTIQAAALSLLAVYFFLQATSPGGLRAGSLMGCVAAYAAATASHTAALPLPALIFLLDLARGRVAALRAHAPAHGVLLFFLVALGLVLGVPDKAVLLPTAGYFGAAALAVVLPVLVALLQKPPLRTVAVLLVLAWTVSGAFLGFRAVDARRDPVAYWQAEANQAQTPDAWRHLAEFQVAQASANNTPQSEALPALKTWRDKAPDDARAARLLGAALLAEGKGAEALPVLQDALRLNPWDGRAAAMSAAILEERARKEGRETLLLARDYYARAHALRQLDKEQLQPYALVLAALGDLGGAGDVLREVVGEAKDGPVAAALQRFDAGRQQIAEREKKVNELFAQKGSETLAIVQRAEVEYLKGRYLQAFYLLNRIVQRDTANVQAWSMLGLVKARMRGADAFLEEYAALPAGTAEAWDDLVKRCAASSLWDAALAYVRRAPGENPELRLATLAQQMRQPQRAEEYLRAAADKAPNDPLPWLRMGDIALQARDIPRASTCVAEAQKRGATDEQLKPLRDQLGAPASPTALPMQKIVN